MPDALLSHVDVIVHPGIAKNHGPIHCTVPDVSGTVRVWHVYHAGIYDADDHPPPHGGISLPLDV